MRILIIGGTHFVGHAMAQAALDAGHDVTLLHRNATDELPGAAHLLADRNGDLAVLAGQTWDATIDVCAYLPGQVRHLHEALGDRGGHHVFISTVSVYEEPATVGADEASPLFDEAADDVTEITGETYGPLKVSCETAAREAYGDAGLAIVRPTYVVGPRDATARYPYWVLRAARGGTILLPGPGEAPMQCIDARDMGAWTVTLAERRISGAFTAARPSTTFAAMVEQTLAALGSDATLVEVDGDWLVGQGVDGAQLPLWSEGSPELALAMGTSRAEATGLTHRPFADVVRDTLAWAQAHPDQATNPAVGLSPEREQELLAAWTAAQA
ncbi:NAD-dependent epimerase/dehydratase family protein [Nocardioides cynanchi]|uniref:NAD-dependent epimerase/dehydratase family protein n=1 Tax=Nocardioides cynanchi TaxID=2558918 RepID=UPI00124835CC|nr:NAD-dependent epimerase/dehydratase family protein [Nocardioides cynanchi]